ncbi:hypothetical protein ONZ45_g4473 [Pleurotus djamor]|nr:hypothetical protein ONZ45_g4473 [Pleurotus djamor]
MDLNPLFTGHTLFRPNGTGGELGLFERAGIDLVHGWLVDPSSSEAPAVMKVQDYDSAVDLIAAADHITQGQLLANGDHVPAPGPSSQSNTSSDEERSKVEDAIAIRHFLDASWSQLTIYGLFELAHTLDPGKLVALFRSSHLAVLYKPPTADAADASIYTLVTDQAFVHEPTVVWERLEDIDGGSSSYFDANFVRSSPPGGDVMGQTAEEALFAAELLADPQAQADHALARQLQYEEDQAIRMRNDEYVKRMEKVRLHKEEQAEKKRLKKEKSCVIM